MQFHLQMKCSWPGYAETSFTCDASAWGIKKQVTSCHTLSMLC